MHYLLKVKTDNTLKTELERNVEINKRCILLDNILKTTLPVSGFVSVMSQQML